MKFIFHSQTSEYYLLLPARVSNIVHGMDTQNVAS